LCVAVKGLRLRVPGAPAGSDPKVFEAEMEAARVLPKSVWPTRQLKRFYGPSGGPGLPDGSRRARSG